MSVHKLANRMNSNTVESDKRSKSRKLKNRNICEIYARTISMFEVYSNRHIWFAWTELQSNGQILDVKSTRRFQINMCKIHFVERVSPWYTLCDQGTLAVQIIFLRACLQTAGRRNRWSSRCEGEKEGGLALARLMLEPHSLRPSIFLTNNVSSIYIYGRQCAPLHRVASIS